MPFIAILEKVLVRPAAPWVLRILLFVEQNKPDRVGLTQEELINAIDAKFTSKLLKDPPSKQDTEEDLAFLTSEGLIERPPGGMIVLSVLGREMARELSPTPITI